MSHEKTITVIKYLSINSADLVSGTTTNSKFILQQPIFVDKYKIININASPTVVAGAIYNLMFNIPEFGADWTNTSNTPTTFTPRATGYVTSGNYPNGYANNFSQSFVQNTNDPKVGITSFSVNWFWEDQILNPVTWLGGVNPSWSLIIEYIEPIFRNGN